MDETERPRELSPSAREEESDPSASAIAQDATFSAAMRQAIEKGLEHAPIGAALVRSARSLSWLGGRGLTLRVVQRQRPRPQRSPPITLANPGPKFRAVTG
jgi:hypothetical protein